MTHFFGILLLCEKCFVRNDRKDVPYILRVVVFVKSDDNSAIFLEILITFEKFFCRIVKITKKIVNKVEVTYPHLHYPINISQLLRVLVVWDLMATHVRFCFPGICWHKRSKWNEIN